jgi:catalase
MHGMPFDNTQTWLKATPPDGTGPALLEDQIAMEKIHRFDHERIPERVVHARGVGAHGHFRVFDDRASKYTFAPVLTDASRSTPVFVRFSTVQGPRGSADTVRDVRGFATKFYTPEGNWDIVGNNIPVFFVQDAMQFPDFVHAVKPEPHNEVPTGQSAHNNFWDFFSLQSQTTHTVFWAMSDRGIPRSLRMMQGFGVNTFSLINAKGERHFVKFHWRPELGVHSLMWDEALKISGQDPDFHRKDLEEAIVTGAYPKWSFGIQVLPESREHDFEFDILDASKIWPEEFVPIEYIGELTLDRCVDEFFAETEQVAFCTSHVVPGIGFSDDPLLQGRNFSYLDTQQSRLGTNWEQLPINRPVCPVLNHIRDGKHQSRITKGLNYWPNRYNTLPPTDESKGGYHEFAQKLHGMKLRTRAPKFQEHYNQTELFYNSLSQVEKKHLIEAISFEVSHCDDPLVYKNVIPQLNEIDHEVAKIVALNVGGDVPPEPKRKSHNKRAVGISQMDFEPEKPLIKSRRIAILLADGFRVDAVEQVRLAIKSNSASTFIIGPRRGKIADATGTISVMADHHFEGQRSTLFDALFIAPGSQSAETLKKDGRVIHWVREAFGHCKAIGALGEGIEVVRKALQDVEKISLASPTGQASDVTVSYGVVTASKISSLLTAMDVLRISGDDKGFLSEFAYEISKHRCFRREMDGLNTQVAF